MRTSDLVLPCLILTLTACGKSVPPDSVNSLVADPDYLRKVEQQCANDYAKMSATECNAASEARHRLFMGNGAQYTPPKTPPKF